MVVNVTSTLGNGRQDLGWAPNQKYMWAEIVG